jgi:parvulin-like peptidyl-prolyl isomerase
VDSPELIGYELISIMLLHNHNVLPALVKSIITSNTVCSTEIDNEYQEQIISEFKRSKSLNEEDSLNDWLKKYRLEYSELVNKLLLPHKVVKYAIENHSGKIEARFLEKKPFLDMVTYSLLRTNDAYQTREIYLKIKEENADFGILAEQYSTGAEKSSRGIIGPAPLAQAHPRVASELRAAQPGEVRAPINVEGVSIILRLETLVNAKLDKPMEQRMATELFDEWINEQVDATISKIWESFSEAPE